MNDAIHHIQCREEKQIFEKKFVGAKIGMKWKIFL